MNASTKHLESIGHLCASLQAPYARVRRAVDELDIKAALTLNGVPHFDEAQAEAIAAHLAGKKPKPKSDRLVAGGDEKTEQL